MLSVTVLPSYARYCGAQLAESLFVEYVATQTQPLQTRESLTHFCTLLANKLVGFGGPVASRCGDCMVRPPPEPCLPGLHFERTRGTFLHSSNGRCALQNLATEATTSFLGNDLFTSLKFFLENAHGSFGLAVCSTLDPCAPIPSPNHSPPAASLNTSFRLPNPHSTEDCQRKPSTPNP